MTNDLKHLAISASAGSGKTFQLAHRYIRLMAERVHPDRIVALTFSRKAAGEIFDSIVHYLCAAASAAEQAKATGRLIDRSDLDSKAFLALLRQFTDNLHRVHIGTLDSFIVGIVRAFPAELGVPGGLDVMDTDGASADEMRRQALGRIFNPRHTDASAQRDFLEAFKQATFGREEKSAGQQLATFIAESRALFQAVSRGECWGDAGCIWPHGSPWLKGKVDAAEAADRLTDRVAKAGYSAKAVERWQEFVDAARSFRGGQAWPRALGFLFEKLADLAPDLRRGSARLSMDRKDYELDAELCTHALRLVTHLMRCELNGALEQTQGIYRILEQYSAIYETLARRQGKFTFDDIQYLLTDANKHSGGRLLSRDPGQGGKLYIDYRLDCRLDHWLLDEFQDTSDLQWRVFENLADEILQDDSGERTFFYVGDVKQAIYGWRGGNADLFDRVLDTYGSRIERRGLAESYRSCEPVIEAVNGVFGDVAAAGLPAGTAAEWRRLWETHTSRRGFVPDSGYAAIVEPVCADGKQKPDEEDRYAVTAAVLREIDPIARGLSAAVLVRTNKAGREAVDALRRHCPGWPIVHEGSATIADNPVVAVLVSLVQFAAHPGDSFAWEHVRMSPLRTVIAGREHARESLPLVLLSQIERDGFQAFVREWGQALAEECALDPFGQQRLSDLVRAAGEFDAAGSRDCGAFIRFVKSYEVRELAAGSIVRVMTVHQSKGLGFDVVLLPDLMSGNLAGGGDLGLLGARERRTEPVRWVLKMPRRVVAGRDEVLSAQVQAHAEQQSLDDMCVLYVALTRARRALYMITSYPGPTSKTLSPAAFVKAQLTGDPRPVGGPGIGIADSAATLLYEKGAREWYRGVRLRAARRRAAGAEAGKKFEQKPRRRRLVQVEPSGQEEFVQRADRLFVAETSEVRSFGTAIHELFEQVAWIEEADAEQIIGAWRPSSGCSEDVKRDVAAQFRRALQAAAVREALAQPEGEAELWREKRFEIVLENEEWLSGAFDRVVIERDATGKVTRAAVIDYKSDRVVVGPAMDRAVETYRPQLRLYGRALSRILRLPESRIALRILFTRTGEVKKVGPLR